MCDMPLIATPRSVIVAYLKEMAGDNNGLMFMFMFMFIDTIHEVGFRASRQLTMVKIHNFTLHITIWSHNTKRVAGHSKIRRKQAQTQCKSI